MIINKLTLQLAAVLLCCGSLLCSVGLWVGEQQTVLAMILAGVFAVGLELCKFAFFPVATKTFKTNPITGVLLYLVSLFLLCVSIAATVAFLETGTNTAINKALVNSTRYQATKRTIASLELEIETVNRLLADDAKFGYRKQGYSHLPELEKSRELKRAAVLQLSNMAMTPTNGSHSIFNALATRLDVPVSTIRQAVYTLVAILVDICGIVCLLLLALQNMKQRVATSETTETTETTETSVVANSFHLKQESETQYATVKQQITNGDYGNKPVMRNIMKKEGLRYPEAKRIFDLLVDEGVLMKTGRRFQLVAGSMNGGRT